MTPTAAAPALIVEVTRDTESVLDAQRLRYEVFAEEMGARLPSAAGRLDVDRHDPHCAHVLVREGRDGRVVACARLLDAGGAMSAGGFYSQQEFEMSRALVLPGRLMEVGRVCVARDRRQGATLSAMWSAVAREASARGISHLIGCASVPFDPEVEALEPLNLSLKPYWSSDSLRVHPLRPVPRDPGAPSRAAQLPPLLATYLRLGALVGGEPSWDPEFGTADYFMIVSVDDMAPRYARRLLGPAEDRFFS
jgi:putative hemolysin